MKFPKRVNVIEMENAPFRNSRDADAWVRSHGVIGLMSDVDTGGKGEVSISARSIDKMLSGSALQKSVTPAIHNQPTKAYSYEINNIEVMAGTAEPQSSPTPQTSMDVDILLKGVCDVNGEWLLKG